jgi:hypothetical protein
MRYVTEEILISIASENQTLPKDEKFQILLTHFKSKKSNINFPDEIYYSLENIQRIGNSASHPKPYGHYNYFEDHEITHATIIHFIKFLKWIQQEKILRPIPRKETHPSEFAATGVAAGMELAALAALGVAASQQHQGPKQPPTTRPRETPRPKTSYFSQYFRKP